MKRQSDTVAKCYSSPCRALGHRFVGGRGVKMMNEAMFHKYYNRYYIKGRVIQRLARKLAKNDRALYEELVQIGLISLWKLNPKKARTNEDAWIRQALVNRMTDFLRKDRPVAIRIESLDARLESGDQLERDAETGQFKLIEHASKKDLLPRDLFRLSFELDGEEIEHEMYRQMLEEMDDDNS